MSTPEPIPQTGGTHVRMPDGRLVKIPEGAADPLAAAQAVLDAEAAAASPVATKKKPAAQE